jgi:hypothetical protein
VFGAGAFGAHFLTSPAYATALLDTPLPWTKMRQVYARADIGAVAGGQASQLVEVGARTSTLVPIRFPGIE